MTKNTTSRPDMGQYIDKIVTTLLDSITEVRHYVGEASRADRVVMIGSRRFGVPPIAAEEVEENRMQLVRKTEARVGVIIDDYIAAEKAFQCLCGADITLDSKLLDGTLNPPESDLRRLAALYEDNYTMYQLVSKYAASVGLLNIAPPMHPPERQADAIQIFWDLLRPRFRELCDPLTPKITMDFHGTAAHLKARALAKLV